MSSYRSNYSQWRGSAGLGASSYSPASSTSSLASTTSTGGSSSKYSSSYTSGIKSPDSTPSRESSFTSGISNTGTPGSGRLSRFSSLSSRNDNTSSITSGNGSTNYGSSNLSTGTKSNFGGSSASSSLSKDKTSGLGNSFGLTSVSALSSKYAPLSSNDTSTSNSFRPPSTSSSFPRSNGVVSSGIKDALVTKPKASSAIEDSTSANKKKIGASGLTSESSSNGTKNESGSTGNNSSSVGSGLGNYRTYASRPTATTDMSKFSTSTNVSSALRTTARFGLRSGPAHAHYSSSLPTASTLKAAAMLAEETKKELNKTNKNKANENNQSTEPVTWISQGTSTTLDSDKNERFSEESDQIAISELEIPLFEPRIFSSRYDGVLKHKAIQTEEQKVQPVSSIPRPSVAMNYYSPFGNARFTSSSTKDTPATKAKNDRQSTPSDSTATSVDNPSEGTSIKELNSTSSSNSKTSSAINNNSHNKTPVTMTSGSDQSSRSSQQTKSNNSVTEASGNCNNEPETSTSGTTTTTNVSKYSITGKGPSSASGLVLTVANKEFRKSALNVGLESKDAEVEFSKKQEELRLQKSNLTTDNSSSSFTPSLPGINNNNSSDNQNNNSLSTVAALLSNLKRDPPRRPPTDPNKSSTSIHQSRSISRIGSVNQQDPLPSSNANGTANPSALSGLAKMKSTKNVSQIRKLSSGSSSTSESESSSSLSATSVGSKVSVTKVKKELAVNNNNSNNNIPDNKGQGRRGSATSGSSAASSRSNSVERKSQINNYSQSSLKSATAIKQEKGSTNSIPSSLHKPPTGSLSSAKEVCKKEPPAKNASLTIAKVKSKASIQKIKEPQEPVAVTEISSPEETDTVQSAFLLRSFGGDTKPWVRKCQSGELPWWMTSNPDVPSILGRNPSKNNLTKNPTAKKGLNNVLETNQAVQEEESSSTELSEDSECEIGTDEIPEVSTTQPLGERTSPDGIEIPTALISPKSTLLGHSNLKLNAKTKSTKEVSARRDSLFIGNSTNIDDILGTVSPSLMVPESPSPALDELCKAQRKMSLRAASCDDDDSSESSSDSSEFEDELDIETKKEAFKRQILGEGEDSEVSSEEEEDDDRSTGTSSSFEEVDPRSVKISTVSQKLNSILSPGATSAPVSIKPEEQYNKRKNSLATASVAAAAGMIPTSQREKLDDATLQLYKDGDHGTYLDLESSISEQQEEFDGFLNNRKNSIVLRAQLPVRVHAIIEKLLTADGRELRRALFSLKQIFQEDKDLVHEFVENGGLSCLIKVGSEADQNYQNYILRAIGQVMLYVDGMYGVMRHNETIQWLYSLVASKFRLVQKTALKLLLVFVDYVETNCLLLVQAVTAVDNNKGLEPWLNIMSLLREHDSNSGDSELLVYAMTLVNKVLNGIPDIDTYYDQVDALEQQGMAMIIQNYMGKQCADLDLLKQFQIYELVLKHEDGDEDNIMMQLDEAMRTKLLNRKGYGETEGQNKERRKSRRYSASTPPTTPNGSIVPPFPRRLSSADDTPRDSPYSSLSSSSSNGTTNGIIVNGHAKEKSNKMELTPGLRRRRERAEHQKNLILEQLVNGNGGITDCNGHGEPGSPSTTIDSPPLIPLGRSPSSKKDIHTLELHNNLKNSNSNSNINGNGSPPVARPWMLPIYTKTNGTAASSNNIATSNGEKENGDATESEKEMMMQLKRENTVKDLTQKLASQNLLASPAEENKSFINTGELSGVVSKAKEGLAKSKSRADMKPTLSENNASTKGIQLEVKKSDNELHWDFLVNNLQRPLEICDLDFTDLKISDDEDILAPDPSLNNGYGFGIPPPVPIINGYPPPPPPTVRFGAAPPPPTLNGLGSPLFGVTLKNSPSGNATECSKSSLKKTKKTVKLFWKEVREDPVTASKVEKVGCIWSEIQPIPLDTQRLEHLFESRAKEVINKKQSEVNKTKEIVVLDPKRSNAINIGMTKLPPPRTIKAAIMKMDSTIINREGIEKLLAMLPTEEERAKITEAQFANPETPLGSAEQFLLTLSSISELTARLKLWAFKLDYENLEREVAEPLMDLKTGIIALEKNKTFRYILSTLLSIGNFLNGADAKGFQIEYLAKVPEVKDTVQKHSLLHHLCQTVNENYPDSTDLYSEIGPVTRASRVDFDEVGTNLVKMENDCKTSWDHLRVIAKHDGPTNLKLKLSEFLADCAERIIVLGMIHRRVVNRFRKFLLWLGVSAHQVTTTKPHNIFKVVSEFALEYRTTRERVIQQLQKKASHRERNKTRGKMITEQIMYKSKEDEADAELREVLKKTTKDGAEVEVVKGSLTWTRRQKSQQTNPNSINSPTTLYHNFQNNKTSTLNGNAALNDGDDEILESLVKTATRSSDTRVANRERKRIGNNARNSDRKSLRRTLRHGLSEEERNMLAAFMASGHSFY